MVLRITVRVHWVQILGCVSRPYYSYYVKVWNSRDFFSTRICKTYLFKEVLRRRNFSLLSFWQMWKDPIQTYIYHANWKWRIGPDVLEVIRSFPPFNSLVCVDGIFRVRITPLHTPALMRPLPLSPAYTAIHVYRSEQLDFRTCIYRRTSYLFMILSTIT